jgi:hypothetical protein
MLGRLFAFGYMRGLMQAVESEERRRQTTGSAGSREAESREAER